MGIYWLQAAGGTILWSFSSITTLPQPQPRTKHSLNSIYSDDLCVFSSHFGDFPLEHWPLTVWEDFASLVLAEEATFSFQFQSQWAFTVCCKCSDNVVILYKNALNLVGHWSQGGAGRKWRHTPLSPFCHREHLALDSEVSSIAFRIAGPFILLKVLPELLGNHSSGDWGW